MLRLEPTHAQLCGWCCCRRCCCSPPAWLGLSPLQHIEAANTALGIRAPARPRPRRGARAHGPAPPHTRELWSEEVGQLLDELAPPAQADGFYGDWCAICGLDDFCASVARDVQSVASGGGAELRYVALANAVGQMGGKYVHGSRH